MRTTPLALSNQSLTLLESLNAARVNANSVPAHASEFAGTYGIVKVALIHALTVEFGADDADEVYATILDTGESVAEAVGHINRRRDRLAREERQLRRFATMRAREVMNA